MFHGLLDRLIGSSPQSRLRRVAAVMTLVALGLLAGAASEGDVAILAGGALGLVIAIGLLQRWRFARVAALLPLALLAALNALALLYNAIMLVVQFPPSLFQLGAVLATAAMLALFGASARWLEGAEAKALLSGTTARA